MGKLSYNTHKKITIITEKAIRVITSSHYIAHTDPLFAMTKLIKLEDLYKYQLGIFMQKVTHSQHRICHPCSYVLIRYTVTNSENKNAYYIQQIRTNTRKSTINFSGPTYWNTLPVNLRQIVSIHLFKKKFKELLQSKYP